MVFRGTMSHGHPHKPLLPHGHRCRHSPQQQHRLGLYQGSRWCAWLLTMGFSSPLCASSSTSLHNAQLLLLSHLSNTYLNTVVALAVRGPRGGQGSGGLPLPVLCFMAAIKLFKCSFLPLGINAAPFVKLPYLEFRFLFF